VSSKDEYHSRFERENSMRIWPNPTALRAAVVLIMLAALVMSGCGDRTGDGLAVGDEAPDFALPEALGATVSLDDYAGAPALLYFHMADG
jgi:hypothetical protein